MSTTPTSLSATVDPHSALLAQRRSECEDYMRGLTVQYDPGENEFDLFIMYEMMIEWLKNYECGFLRRKAHNLKVSHKNEKSQPKY